MIRGLFPWFGVVGMSYALEEALSLPVTLEALFASPVAYLTIGAAILALWVVVPRRFSGEVGSFTATFGGLLFVSLGGVVVAARLATSHDVLHRLRDHVPAEALLGIEGSRVHSAR